MVAPIIALAAAKATTVAGIALSKILISAGVVLGGLILTGYLMKKFEKTKDEGFKEGHKNASLEYEEKLKKQAEAFQKEVRDAEQQIKEHKNKRDVAEKLAMDAMRLLGEFEGCIKGLKEQGLTPAKETTEIHLCLKIFVNEHVMSKYA